MVKILSGFAAGLSVGVYCIGLCLPLFLPMLLAKRRGAKSSFLLVLEFSAGRLLGYLAFGLIFGWFGQTFKSSLIHQVVSLGNIWAGIVMILFSLGMMDKAFCAAIPFKKIKWPILLGFLTGVNVCPPFLASLTFVFNLQDALASLAYFFMFFLGTSVYIIPSALLGVFTRLKWMQKLAQISGVLVGLYFVVQSLARVF